jgi:hypothetical protein
MRDRNVPPVGGGKNILPSFRRTPESRRTLDTGFHRYDKGGYGTGTGIQTKGIK